MNVSPCKLIPRSFLESCGRLLAALCICLIGSLPLKADQSLERLFGLGPLETFTINSATLDRAFYIYVRLPLNYAETSCNWPVVYLLDGGILFPMLAPHQLMMEFDEQAAPVVMVGISYGGLGFSNGNLRSTDYTAPADEPEYYGGAFDYQDFLANELIPKIEADYRIDQTDSLILGQSLGGQFTLLSALTRPNLFGHYLSINPALHANVDYFIQLEPVRRSEPTPLLLTRSTEERARFSTPLQRWLNHWQRASNEALELDIRWLSGQYHASSAPAAYREAIDWWSPSKCE